MSEANVIELHYRIEPALDAWVLPEVKVSESPLHDRIARQLVELFEAWRVRTGADVAVARNLAVRWIREKPRVGIDPDVCLIQPRPSDLESHSSLCTWEANRNVPTLAIEVVSKSHPYKDYADIQEKYAALGVAELWVLDPGLLGPKKLGGPLPLQVWRRESPHVFSRRYFGAGPYYSDVVNAWVRVGGRSVAISDDESGNSVWLTGEETERAAKEAERAAKEAERAAKEAERAAKEAERAAREALEVERQELEARVRELEERLRSR